MAIDMNREQLLSYTEAATALTRVRPGRKLSRITIWRWAHKGLRGVMLEVVRFGGSECTSLEALQRFFTRLPASQRSGPRIRLRTRREQRRIDRDLNDYCRREGIPTKGAV